MSELTTRQWNLYNYLKTKDDYVPQMHIGFDLYGYVPHDSQLGIPFHDTTERLNITDDIRAINDSDVIQKIIISNSNGIKIATEEEFKKFILSKFKRVWRDLARARRLLKKAGLHNQKRVVWNTERDFIEAFMVGVEGS